MGLFKRAHVRGINFELMRRGLVAYPNEKVAEEVADAIADELPEETVPEVTGEEGLSPEDAAGVIDQLVDVAEEIAQKVGGVTDPELNKLAASVDYEKAASAHAQDLMDKAAVEAGTSVTGDGRFQNDIMEGEGQIDAAKNPSSEVVGPQGTSDLDASAGAVGAERPQEDTPGATAVTAGEVAKLSSLLAKLSQEDKGTGPGSGGMASPGYAEPDTNMGMSGVAPDQGKTVQPKGPLIGEQIPQPAKQTISPATPGEVAKLSSVLNQALAYISKTGGTEELPPELKEHIEKKKEEKEEDKDENGEKKDEEKKEENGQKEAAELLTALRVVAKHLPA
jgi:hypothetical protein